MIALNLKTAGTLYEESEKWLLENIAGSLENPDIKYHNVLCVAFDFMYAHAALNHLDPPVKSTYTTDMFKHHKGNLTKDLVDFLTVLREYREETAIVPAGLAHELSSFNKLYVYADRLVNMLEKSGVGVRKVLLEHAGLNGYEVSVALCIKWYNDMTGAGPCRKTIMCDVNNNSSSKLDTAIKKLVSESIIEREEGVRNGLYYTGP